MCVQLYGYKHTDLASLSERGKCFEFDHYVIDNLLTVVSFVEKRVFELGLRRYGHQPYQYVFDTDLADTIRIRYDTHVHDLRFQSQEFKISTTKLMFWIDI